MGDAVRLDGALLIPAHVVIADGLDARRYRLLTKLQLTEPGKGKHPGYLRNFLADANCDARDVRVLVPGYLNTWGLYLDTYQVLAHFIIIDNVTGYRSQSHQQSFILSVR